MTGQYINLTLMGLFRNDEKGMSQLINLDFLMSYLFEQFIIDRHSEESKTVSFS
jgi:hypothetical protein